MRKRKRRNYSKGFKEEAVKLISEQGYSYADAGRNLGVNPNLLSRWKREIEGEEVSSSGNTVALPAELQLKLEREILKKAAAFFAKEQK